MREYTAETTGAQHWHKHVFEGTYLDGAIQGTMNMELKIYVSE